MLTKEQAQEIIENNEIPVNDEGEMGLIEDNNPFLYDAYMELNKIANGESGQLETAVSPEILSAIEYGYRQCEKGKSLQKTLENARG